MSLSEQEVIRLAQSLEALKLHHQQQISQVIQFGSAIQSELKRLQSSLAQIANIDSAKLEAIRIKISSDTLTGLASLPPSAIAASLPKSSLDTLSAFAAYPAGLTALINGPGMVGMAKAVEVTGRARKTLYNAVADGRLPAHKLGHTLLFSMTDLLNYKLHPRAIKPTNKHE